MPAVQREVPSQVKLSQALLCGVLAGCGELTHKNNNITQCNCMNYLHEDMHGVIGLRSTRNSRHVGVLPGTNEVPCCSASQLACVSTSASE